MDAERKHQQKSNRKHLLQSENVSFPLIAKKAIQIWMYAYVITPIREGTIALITSAFPMILHVAEDVVMGNVYKKIDFFSLSYPIVSFFTYPSDSSILRRATGNLSSDRDENTKSREDLS